MRQNKISKAFWIKLVSAPIFMLVFAIFIMPPIYDVICDITGLNGKTGRADNNSKYVIDENRKIKVSFFASTMPGLPIDFGPKITSMEVVPGKFYTASYVARNSTDKVVVGQAVPSVAPENAAIHFKKLECFCFDRQEFKANEEVEMPIRFVVEPQIDESVKDISLSYNFFKLDS